MLESSYENQKSSQISQVNNTNKTGQGIQTENFQMTNNILVDTQLQNSQEDLIINEDGINF